VKFDPKFIKVTSVQECADLINQPHEDYPQRVDRTAKMIQYYIDTKISYLTEFIYKGIHSHIMYDLEPRNRGQWRNVDVTVGEFQPCAPWMIQTEIEENQLNIIKFDNLVDESDIIRWYRAFEIVHPFIDGNGRVGGVIAAIASNYLSEGEWLLAPLQ